MSVQEILSKALILIFAIAASPGAFAQELPRKLIEFGWDEPDTAFMRAHIGEMKQTPFHGCVFHVNFIEPELATDDARWVGGGSGNFTWSVWGTRAFTEAHLQRAVADLNATDFGHFDQNFVRVNVTPGNVDWFDDFSAIVNNCRLAARVARAGKCKGILLDTEQYEDPLFNYRKQRDAGSKSWEQYAAQARQRGAEVMGAFQESYPNVTVFLTFGYSLPWSQSEVGKRSLADCDYGLLAPFLDGMVQAANGQSKIVDGHELSYGYREPKLFDSAYTAMKRDLLPIVQDPKKYASVFSSGFGIWLDYNWRANGWDASDAGKNYFSPEKLAQCTRSALQVSDEYVWIYSETPRWWSKEGTSVNLPGAYAEALRKAKAAETPQYLPANAYYILPETHNNQSGYFSLCEGLDGSVYVGTAKYGENAYLVEFDPQRETQRVVIDTNKVCGVNATGYAAQAKIHTRNFVGPSGTVYVGSKQGYRLDPNDKSEYPGGYVMTYDPRTGATQNLGMPFPGQGVADVVADEVRGLTYIVTCEDQHWMLGDVRGEKYRELGPLLTPYAMTLIAADERAYAITKDFQLASYDPTQDKVAIRPIELNGSVWSRANESSIPTWVLGQNRKNAYLVLMNDPTLLEIELTGDGPNAKAKSHGAMKSGKNPDCRCGMDLGADGNVYAIVRIDNETGFGSGYLHHVTRFVSATGIMEDLGVVSVANPEYFPWGQMGPDGKPQPWTHGFHKLPDGTLTPLHAHMSLMAAADNTLYATIIYPFTLLRVDKFRISPALPTAVERYIDWGLELTRTAEKSLAEYTRVAEIIAQRHINGGAIGFPIEWQALPQDLWGRSGGLVHLGFTRSWKENRSDAEKANDIGIVGYDSPPASGDLAMLQQLKSRGVYLVGLGPRQMGSLKEIVAICDAWFDTGFGDDDRVVDVGAGMRAGHANVAANAIHGATLIAEIVGALTRKGHMPPIWRGYAYPDGPAWGEKYLGKMQFHNDIQVPALNPGELGGRLLKQIRFPMQRLRSQSESLQMAASFLSQETAANRKVYVVWQGHMPPTYIGKREDSAWAVPIELHPKLDQQVENYRKSIPDGALVLNLGYHGLDPVEARVRREKNHRVIHMSGGHLDPVWQPGPDELLRIDLGFAFGDACVTIEGYPQRLFAPSGIAQVIAYEAIQTAMAQ